MGLTVQGLAPLAIDFWPCGPEGEVVKTARAVGRFAGRSGPELQARSASEWGLGEAGAQRTHSLARRAWREPQVLLA